MATSSLEYQTFLKTSCHLLTEKKVTHLQVLVRQQQEQEEKHFTLNNFDLNLQST